VYCQVEISATGRSLIQMSSTECGVPECDLETSTMRKPRPIRAVQPWKRILNVEFKSENLIMKVLLSSNHMCLFVCVCVCVWVLSDEGPTSHVVIISVCAVSFLRSSEMRNCYALIMANEGQKYFRSLL
jgi:hypothetical protein